MSEASSRSPQVPERAGDMTRWLTYVRREPVLRVLPRQKLLLSVELAAP